MSRRILITAALPYANGDIHIGHLVEYIQADIWNRFQNLTGNECYFICAVDAHGTPVMLKANEKNITPEELIETMKNCHLRDFNGFGIAFDNYHSTHSIENKRLAEKIFSKLQDDGLIVSRKITQLYDNEKNMFLPDRYVIGICPKCGSDNQYGDSCEKCGAVYSSNELKNPKSVLSKSTPVEKESIHYFLHLNSTKKRLIEWIDETIDSNGKIQRKTQRLQKEVRNKINEWINDDLNDWDISRDAPYFGFRIPGIEDEKYFYVWLDAPIGYMASFENFCNNNGLDFDEFWKKDSETELYHFIGKDILYFHALYWPVILNESGYRRPTRIFAHGFLNVNGEKMSKSRGTFITARHYLDLGLNPDYLRYYYASKLNDRLDDLNLNLDDFQNRINSDLIGKLINIPSRVSGFLNSYFDNSLCETDDEYYNNFILPVLNIEKDVADAYENRKYHEAIRLLMKTCDLINSQINNYAPWNIEKDADGLKKIHCVCSAAIRAFHLLVIMLQPVIPRTANDICEILNHTIKWEDGLNVLPNGHVIQKWKHLLKRIDAKDINALLSSSSDK